MLEKRKGRLPSMITKQHTHQLPTPHLPSSWRLSPVIPNSSTSVCIPSLSNNSSPWHVNMVKYIPSLNKQPSLLFFYNTAIWIIPFLYPLRPQLSHILCQRYSHLQFISNPTTYSLLRTSNFSGNDHGDLLFPKILKTLFNSLLLAFSAALRTDDPT